MLHISSLPKTSCCGCSACSLSCPLQLISMTPDAEGFLYPKIQNPEQCIHCGKCKKVCLMDVDPTQTPDSPECIRCGACAQACPTGAIRMGFGIRKKEKSPSASCTGSCASCKGCPSKDK